MLYFAELFFIVMPPSFRFDRTERLKSAKVITALFQQGQSLVAYPLRAVWIPQEREGPPQVLVGFSVSKRLFKTAVQRNRLKRQMREAYRLQRHLLLEKLGEQSIALMISYIAKEPLAYPEIEAGIQKMIRKMTSNTEATA